MNAKNPFYKAIVWIVILVAVLSLASLACDEGSGCNQRDPVTGICVDGNVSQSNPVSEGAKDFLCKNQTNPDYDDYCN